ncbi:transferase hexapeptide repeat containing protein [Chthoniobacter flavus Ellin428]|uniref:Transferase hexapeptide repeat containing protein n=1 Tax=Chthoniobacter flavus Ellin428 TaxID=497964 RepID=B4D5E8_9BACT|nr:acyltransferase [Chthoniobacter flavus]EDY18353.1 transferase hexapeptide repeat containing protein [Chthoniobacter flavus Ellin428]TCO91375.1 transferase family hexapeptide repeat protein [Chthoniobacter flavus]
MDLTRFLEGLTSRARIAYYRSSGMHIHGHVSLRAIEVRQRPQCITLEDGAALDRGVVLLATSDRARIVIGPRTYINRHTMIDADELIEIGESTMIGPFCYITDHDHTVSAWAAPADGPLVTAPTRLGARCWIGAHVTILKGVSIGEGTVVGAGSVVTKSLPAGVIAVGNPAKVLREIAP